MKKILLGFMIFAVLGLVVACDNDNGGASEGTNDGGATGGETSSDEQVTIRFSWWDGVPQEEITFITAFEATNPDIRVEVISIPDSDYSQQINTMVLGGTAPDVILAFEVDLPRFAENDAILPLDERINASDLIEMDDFIPAVAALSELTQGTFGIPWVYAGHLLYFNMDLFDEAGIDYPTADWTWEDFAVAAEQLTVRDGGRTVQFGADSIGFGGIWYSMIAAGGDAILSDDMNLELGAGLRRALEFQYRLTSEGISPEPSSGGDVADLFASGRAAMTRNGSWMVRGYQNSGFRFDVVPMPRDMANSTSLHTGFFTINSASDHPEEAWRFVEFMMSHEGQTLISEFTGNPSAIRSIAAEGAYILESEYGPFNWDAFDAIAEYGSFSYTLLNSTVTSGLVNEFNSVLLGQKTIDEIIDVEVPRAIERLEDR